MRRLHTYAEKIVRQKVERYRASALGDVMRRIRDGYDDMVIENRQNKNRDLLTAMHQEVRETPPLRCNSDAGCELHTLTAHHHVCMYLAAIKSLLIHFQDVAVVVHDDGTLIDDDKSLLDAHVKGIRIVDKKYADAKMAEVLAPYPHCAKLRARIVNSLELFDNILLSDTEKLINMNSDVLFFERPAELIGWIENSAKCFKGVFEAEPAEQKAFLKVQGCRISPHVTTALTCFHRSVLDLEYVETVLSGIRPGWFTSQNFYPLLYYRKRDEYPSLFFDEERYQASGNFDTPPVFRHYWTSTGFFTDIQTKDSVRVVDALRKRG